MLKTILFISLILTVGFAILLFADQNRKGSEKTMITSDNNLEKAVFAGGCFWCMTPPFRNIDGVKSVVAGYTGGKGENASYDQVSSGATGHYEAVEVTYDPAKVTYEDLLETFWRNIDPTDSGGQFADRGSQYQTAVFYKTEKQKKEAEASKDRLGRSGKFPKPVATKILPAGPFYAAEEYHQDYDQKNPSRYKLYKSGSGRERFIEQTWQSEPSMAGAEKTDRRYIKPSDNELKKKLSQLEYDVTQHCSTEPPFNNKYWDNKKEGIYVDIVSGEPLFSSADKYDSGTGWPSFTKPLEPQNLVEKEDTSLFTKRTEIRSRNADSHLGHVFGDGPAPTGRRYCMNSASLRFIPKEELEKEGYSEYLKLFRKK